MKKLVEFNAGDIVAFARHVLKRVGDPNILAARGRVVEINGPIVTVDFEGSWNRHESGSTLRFVPAGNLTKIKGAK